MKVKLKLQIIELPSQPNGYVNLSNSADWEAWIRKCLPAGFGKAVHDRLVSNLKHILVGLEMKAALVVPHAKARQRQVASLRALLSGHEFRVLRRHGFHMRGVGLSTLVDRERPGPVRRRSDQPPSMEAILGKKIRSGSAAQS